MFGLFSPSQRILFEQDFFMQPRQPLRIVSLAWAVGLLFATGAAGHQLWPAFGLTCAISITVAGVALRGARW